jgi:PAS domain S-box-containing protein
LAKKTAAFGSVALGRPTAQALPGTIYTAWASDGSNIYKQEGKLPENKQWLWAILRSIHDSVIAMDTQGRVTFMNPSAEALTGWKYKKAIGRNLTEVFSIIGGQIRTLPKGSVTRVLREGVNYTICLPKGRTAVFLENSAALIKDAKGNIAGSVLVLRDITEPRLGQGSPTHLLGQIMSRQEEEQRRVAHELHDETGQALTCLLVGLRLVEDAPTLEKAKTQANRLRHITAQTVENLGRLIRGLHPDSLEDLGLGVALTRYATTYAQSCGFTVNVHINGLDAGRLPCPVEIALYRIVQVALTNIAKHAAANVVRIVLERQPSRVQVIVADDGCGFDVDTTLRTTTVANHMGLYGMYERATLSGGSITVQSKLGKGTTVSVQIPLEGWEPCPRDGPQSVCASQ